MNCTNFSSPDCKTEDQPLASMDKGVRRKEMRCCSWGVNCVCNPGGREQPQVSFAAILYLKF